MTRTGYPENIACPKCDHMSRRVLETFLNEKSTVSDERKIVTPEVGPWIVLNWFCCITEECENRFNKIGDKDNTSRCPTCKLWSVHSALHGENTSWACKNPECQWKFEIKVP